MPSLARLAIDRERSRARSNNRGGTEPSLGRLLALVSNEMEQIPEIELGGEEVADTASELAEALGRNDYREAIIFLLILVRMTRSIIERSGAHEMQPINGSVVRSLLRSTEELEWIHGDGDDLPRAIVFRLDEDLVSETERAAESEDPRVEEYWRASGRWLEESDNPDHEERPRWPEGPDPTVPRPGLPLSFLCTAHAWALAAVLRSCSSLRRGRYLVYLQLLHPLAVSLDLLHQLDDEHDRYLTVRDGEDEDGNFFHEALDVLARERASLERVVADHLASLYGLERLEFIPPLWLEGQVNIERPRSADRERNAGHPVTEAASRITVFLASRDLAGSVESLAQACAATTDALDPVHGVPGHRRTHLADRLRSTACDIAWGMNRIQSTRGVVADMATITRFLRHVEGRTDNSYGSPIAWTLDAFRMMAEEHLLAMADALDPLSAGEVGVRPDHTQFGGIPYQFSSGMALSRARVHLRRYDGPLSSEGLGGDWGEEEGARLLAALRELVRSREGLSAAIDMMIARENEDMTNLTDGHVLWGDGMAAVPRLEPVSEETHRDEGGTLERTVRNAVALEDGTGMLHYVYPRFIDRALDIIEERGNDIRPLGTSGSGELVLEINGRVVTAHRNLDYYTCSCEDSHYRSAEDRHLCKHVAVAAILFGDFELREDLHLQRAEALSTQFSDIRERVLAERGGRAEHLRQTVLRQLVGTTDRNEIELRQRRAELHDRIRNLEIQRMETPLHDQELRRVLRQELERQTAELESINRQLEGAGPARRRPGEVPRRMESDVLEGQRETLRARILQLQVNIEEINARIRGSGPEILEGNERRELIHQQAALEQELARSSLRLEDVQHQLQRFEARGRSEPVTRAEVRAPPGMWECAPPGEGS